MKLFKSRTLSVNSDALGQLLDEGKQSRRKDIWLWLHLYISHNVDLDPATCNGETMRDEIANRLRRDHYLLNKIPSMRDSILLPDKNLEWLADDERQFLWLQPKIERITNEILPVEVIRLHGRTRLIAMIDIWNARLEEKAPAIEALHQRWIKHKANDTRLKWFNDKKNSSARCICAWEWIKQNYPSQHHLIPISNYQDLLKFFDQEQMDTIKERAIIDKIRRKWNQAEHEKRTEHMKQLNVKVSITAISQLDRLASEHRLTRCQIIEMLLKKEAVLGQYLSGD